MEKGYKGNIWDQLETLKVIDLPKEEIYYCNNAISDYKPKDFRFWLFVRKFILTTTKNGKLKVEQKKDVIEFQGETLKKMENKFIKFVDSCEGEVPEEEETNNNWIPIKWQNLKDSIKVYNKNL